MTQVSKITTIDSTTAKPSTNPLIIGLSIFGLLLAMSFSLHAHADGAGKIVKWKDEKGAIHYGDKIPAQYANGENTVMSKQGIAVQRYKPINPQNQALNLAKQEQDKKDKALLSAFTNESEIDLARDRNLQLDQVTVEGLQLQKTNTQKRLSENQNYADGFVKRKKPIPADLTTDIKSGQAEISKQDQQIAERKTSIVATRKRFDDDKKRYIALKNLIAGDVSPSKSNVPAK